MASATEPGRRANQFKPGQSGNPAGRPRGSRVRISETFLDQLAADFDQHGTAAIVAVRQADPSTYLKVIAGLVPKQLTFDAESGVHLGVVMLPAKGSC